MSKKHTKPSILTADTVRERGLAAFRQKDFGAAIHQWSHPMLAEDARVQPALAEAHFRHALTVRHLPAECVKHLRQAVTLAPSDARFAYHFALALHRADELKEAEAAYARAVELGANYPGLNVARGLAALERQPKLKLEKLTWLTPADRAALEPVVALTRGQPQKLLEQPANDTLPPHVAQFWQGLAWLAAGEGAKARAALELPKGRVLRAGAENVRTFYHSLAAAQMGQVDVAQREWRAAQQAAEKSGLPVLPRLREVVAQTQGAHLEALAATGQWEALDKALGPLNDATPMEADDAYWRVRLWLHRVQAATAAKDWALLTDLWEFLAELVMQFPALGSAGPAWRNFALAAEAAEDWEAAADGWAEVLRALPRPRRATKPKKKKGAEPETEAPGAEPVASADVAPAPPSEPGPTLDEQRAWLSRRVVENFRRAGQPQEAIAYHRQLLKANPEDLAVRLDLASALLANGQAIAARNEAKRVLDKDPQNVSALLLQAEISTVRGYWYEARKHFEAAYKINPKHEGVRLGLSRHLKEEGNRAFNFGNYEGAQEHYLRALEVMPTDAETLVWLAEIELIAAHPAAAQAYLDRAVANDDPQAYAQAAAVLLAHNAEAEARALVARAEAAGKASPAFYLTVGVECLAASAPPPPPPSLYGKPPPPPKANPVLLQWGRDLLETAIAAQPLEMLRAIVALLVEKRLTQYVLEYGRRLLAQAPEDIASYLVVAVMTAMGGDKTAALDLLKQAEKMAKQTGQTHMLEEIREARAQIKSPLFGFLGNMFNQFGPDFLDEMDEELYP